MELGGKSANIVFEDADVPAACAFNIGLSVGAFAGQGCGLPTRMLVHESFIHDEVVDRVRAVVAAIYTGDRAPTRRWWPPRSSARPPPTASWA